MTHSTHLSEPLPVSSWRLSARLPIILTFIFSIIASLFFSYLMIQTDGNIFAGVAVIALITVIAITFYRLDWGFFVFVFCVFLFDQWIPGDLKSVTSEAGYFLNLNAIRWLPTIDQGVVTPMELQLAMIFFVWILLAALRKSIHLTTIPLKMVTAMFTLTLVGWIVFGQSRGGDFVSALWETRALFYLIIMFIFVPQVIQTKEQLQTLIWVCIAGITAKAAQGALRFAGNGFSFGWWPHIYETFTNHEDPVFMITLFILLMALSLLGGNTRQRKTLVWLLIPLLLGFIAAQRRATYASFMASTLAFIALLPSRERRKSLKILAAVAVVFGVYLGVFWNVNNRLGSVAQQFKATVTDEGGVRGNKDVESTMYREAENYNLGFTFRSAPITGIGFGQPFLQPIRMWGVQGLSLGKYIPHNQILWFFVKTGVFGGFMFWFFFNCYIFYATVVYRRLKDPYLRAVCIVCIVQVVNQFVVSYVDMQLTYYRNMIYLGTLMGVVAVLDSLNKAQEIQQIGGTSRKTTSIPT